MNKSTLVEFVATNANLKKKDAEKLIEDLPNIVLTDPDNYIGPLNSDYWEVGHAFYKDKDLLIRISILLLDDEEMLNKLHVVADYEGRSANSQILVLIRDLIEEYEAKHGEIKTGKRQ